MSTQTQNASARKRILSVTVRRIVDADADTSYLGEYGNTPKSDYAIDRAHSEDCIENDLIQKGKLERIADAIENIQSEEDHWSSPNGCHEDCPACSEETVYECAANQIRELVECDCGSSGHWNRREYRYFNPNYKNYAGLPEDEIRKYCRQDFDRMESLNAGNWNYIGVRAEARVLVNEKVIGPVASHGIAQTITSGGLYGIESDSGKDHIAETIREELASLKSELLALGFSKRAISTAFKNVEEKGD